MIDLKEREEKLYINIEDCQGDCFGMYRCYTAEQWRQQAIDWADSWENPELTFDMKYYATDQDLIDFINDMWEIHIVEFKYSKEVIDYLKETVRAYRYDTEGEWARDLLNRLGVE